VVETTAEEGGGATGTVMRIDRALRERPKVVLSSSGGLDGGFIINGACAPVRGPVREATPLE